MYTREMSVLGHKDQIKDAYRRSIKNDAALTILSQNGCQHALGMTSHTLEQLLKDKGMIVAEDSGRQMSAFSSHSTLRRVLKKVD